jgi:hypothetical protein
MRLSEKNEVIIKNKKSAWDLIKEIPVTPAQRKIDKEIAAIERKYEEKNKKENNFYIKKKYKNSNKRIKYKTFKEEDFGLFAGKIWNALNIYGPLNKTSLLENTKLKNDDFFIGIGWLARENKISKNVNYYKLGSTNLTYEIGENAGRIWNYLNLNGQTIISSIKKSVQLKNEELCSAIGWLSCENKIKFTLKDKKLLCELK